MARITSSLAEANVTQPSGDDLARVTTAVAEAVITVPAADTKARLTGIFAESAVTLPAADAFARFSNTAAEITLQREEIVHVAMVVVEVFCAAPGDAPRKLSTPQGGPQGAAVSSLRR